MLPGVDAIRAGYTTDAKSSFNALVSVSVLSLQGCPAVLPFQNL